MIGGGYEPLIFAIAVQILSERGDTNKVNSKINSILLR